jgi:hypothetical protein
MPFSPYRDWWMQFEMEVTSAGIAPVVVVGFQRI